MNPEGRLSRLLDALSSDQPAPASGSAAAAVVAVAAALLQKVALRSMRRWRGAAAANRLAETIRLRGEELIELDSLAYLAFVAAVRSSSGVEAARQRTIDVPGEIAALAAEVVILARELELRGNPNLRPDAVAAATLAQAARETAKMLVEVNESARRPASPVRKGDRGRASTQSPGSDRRSGPRSDRGGRSAASAAPRRASARSRSASGGSRSTRRARPRGESR
ncbi:MAG: cyclodeaminase/cyclohydrolase family protein [Chloroflexi bacterium]|nr:MAG: cyclodeaminase/cyclohydrolase family protein [Chloroflexota bacterium]